MVQLWVDAHPQVLDAHDTLDGEKISSASFVDDTLSLIKKGVLKLEVTEKSGMIRVRMLARDPTTGRWT